jgi:hypothetical protein
MNRTPSAALATLLDPVTLERHDWRSAELGALWQAQLAAPLDFDLRDVTPDAPRTLATVVNPPQTFGELFRHPEPPVELLRLAQQFGKRHRQDPDSGLPAEIATAIYFVSIELARVRCGRPISELTAESLRKGVQWTLAQPWLDPATRAVLADTP